MHHALKLNKQMEQNYVKLGSF